MLQVIARGATPTMRLPRLCTLRAVELLKETLKNIEQLPAEPAPGGHQLEEAFAHRELLLVVLRYGGIEDIELEQHMVTLRRALLTFATHPSLSKYAAMMDAPWAFELVAELAKQCNRRQYVWEEIRSERDAVEELSASVLQTLQSEDAESQLPHMVVQLALIGCYGSLRVLPAPIPRVLQVIHSDLVAGKLSDQLPQRTALLLELLEQQIAQPAAQRKLQQNLPALPLVGVAGDPATVDSTSSRVSAQYEESPYPVWSELPIWIKELPPVGLAAMLQRCVPFSLSPEALGHAQQLDADAAATGTKINVLVAGGGTGLHPIATAKSITNAKVISLDLSSASLGFAIGKAKALGIPEENLSFMQGNLLQLPNSTFALAKGGVGFDYIESAGVLHHLASPAAGLASLVTVLRPGGFLYIALYSLASKKHTGCVAAKKVVAENRDIYNTTIQGMRQLRQKLMTMDGHEAFQTTWYSEFYDADGLRDKLLHESDDYTTLPKMAAMGETAGLEFLGLDLTSTMGGPPAEDMPSAEQMHDMNKWQTIENKHPALFTMMYRMYFRKPPS